ncbi:MAG: hypothetical protein QNK20_16550 [Aureibaculum sp.]|nr:hypothetical protein [Aureibaculum sp.]
MTLITITSSETKVRLKLNDLSTAFNHVKESSINKCNVVKLELVSSDNGYYIEISYVTGNQNQLTVIDANGTPPVSDINGDTDIPDMQTLYDKLDLIF